MLMHHHTEMLKFSIGDKVSFEPSGRGRLAGKLIKYRENGAGG